MERHGEGWWISNEEWSAVQGRLDWLAALEAAGVDNWEGYDVAVRVLDGGDPYE